MKNIITAVILGIVFAGVSFAQARGGVSKTSLAVVEFTPGPNTSLTDPEAKRQIQAFVASQLHKTHKFDVYDVRNTRAASQSSLAALNGGSTAAAVKLGKQLKVSYVLTGSVVAYDPKDGQVKLRFRLVDVATGKVKISGESTGNSNQPIRTGGTAEMMSKAVRPAVLDLTGKVAGV